MDQTQNIIEVTDGRPFRYDAHRLRPIADYPGYFVSRDGYVFATTGGSLKPVNEHIHAGYRYVTLGYGAKGYRRQSPVLVHRLVLETFVGPRPSRKQECRHLNGNAFDNRASNLKWGTHSENTLDSIRHGTHYLTRAGGEAHPTSILTEEQAKAVITRSAAGESLHSIARAFGVSASCIAHVRVGRNWKHLHRIAAISDESKQSVNRSSECVVNSIEAKQDGMGTGGGMGSKKLPGEEMLTDLPSAKNAVGFSGGGWHATKSPQNAREARTRPNPLRTPENPANHAALALEGL